MLRASGAICRAPYTPTLRAPVRSYSKLQIASRAHPKEARPVELRSTATISRSLYTLRAASRLTTRNLTKLLTSVPPVPVCVSTVHLPPGKADHTYFGFVSQRYLSTAHATDIAVPSRSDKIIATWLLVLCGMVFIMVILGGVTRLTESGLSITEWKPIVGAIPPISDVDWEVEFAKYKKSPEYIKLHYNMTLEQFKFTYYMEWGHRFWGRIIGIVYGLPFIYFLAKGHIKSPALKRNLAVIFALGGFQGALGWYMVKSGLEVDANSHEVPRVSQYRLAAHLSAAFGLYSALLWTSMNLLFPKPAHTNMTPAVKSVRRWAIGAAHMTGLTALSGAFVAGLDAGLVYNTWPLMGDDLVPEDILQLQPWTRNFTENSTTVQFQHRYLAYTTVGTVLGTWFAARKAKSELTPRARAAVNTLLGVSALQATLGVTTLLTFVPTPLAAMHQAGSLTLLSAALWSAHELRRPKKLPKL